MTKIEELKRAKLLDILRRVIANPQNAETVADEIVQDWFPMIEVAGDGSFKLIMGSGAYQ